MFIAGHIGDRVDLRYFLTGAEFKGGGYVCWMGDSLLHACHP